MRFTHAVELCAGFAVVCGLTVYAETGRMQTQPPTGATTAPSQERGTAEQITVVGCVEREADYRRAREAGRGGVAGTGVGAGNEFVLTGAATPKGAGSATAGTAGSETPASAGGTAATGLAYELTGQNEGQAAQYVGRRVEISGKLKPAEVDASGRATGGATAGKPPEGVDIAGKDLKLRELEVGSIREVGGACQAK